MNEQRKLSAKGLNFIKSHEERVLKAYKDAGYGWARATIGYGHTSLAGPPKVYKGMVITAAEANAILKSDLEVFENIVKKNVKVPLAQGQYDALVSFVFNVGGPNFSGSTLLRKLNREDYSGAAMEFPKWRKSNGKVLRGLIKRRAAEQSIFLADYVSEVEPEPIGVPELDTGKPLPKSTSVWTMVLQALGTIGTAVLTLGEKQPVLVGVITLAALAAAVYLISERRRHARDGLV